MLKSLHGRHQYVKKEKTITLHLDELRKHHHAYSQVSAEPSDLSLLPMSVIGGEEELTVGQIHCQRNRKQNLHEEKVQLHELKPRYQTPEFPLAIVFTATSEVPNACDTH